MEKVALDTSVCVELMKNRQRGNILVEQFSDKDIFLTSVGLFELLLRSTNLEIVEKMATRFNLLIFNEPAARKAAEIFKELKSSGNIIGSNDIFIAATAIANNCALATLNWKDFSKVKGLRLVKIG